jgi:hypothetical protein
MHKLDLYRAAVQHPQAEANFARRVHAYGNRNHAAPLRLKEDFAGSASVAALWCLLDPRHEAWAVERHAATARFAQRHVQRELGREAARCHVIRADVHDVTEPRVDIVLALNFSVFIYHERSALCDYFAAARKSLRPGGALIIDAYGGPGAMTPMLQKRRVPASCECGTPALEYQWQQVSHDAATGRVDNRIHFRVGRRLIRNAFRYDWRLWSLPELREAMLDAGFARATAWCDRYDPAANTSDGVYRPTRTMPNRHDWVAYVSGHR